MIESLCKRMMIQMREEIGFKHGIPVNRDTTLERQIGGITLVFSKTWEPEHKKFLYGCHTKDGNGNTFYHSSDLDIEDLVNDERFVNIRGINATRCQKSAVREQLFSGPW